MSGTLRLRGSTSGYSELQAPAVAADQTFVLPTAGGTLLTTDSPVPKLTLELGSASQPSLTFQGDTDTGLFSEGTNTLNLVTGGSSKVVLGAAAHTIYAGTGATVRAIDIDSSGNVGVGTTSPVAPLVISNSGAEGWEIGYTSGTTELVGYNRSTSARTPMKVIGQTFLVQTGNPSLTNGLYQDSSGNVGIGTTSPTYMLDVQGTDAALRLKGTASTGFIADQATSGLVSLINYDSGADLRFGTASTERMRIDSSGRVGVGTSSPQQVLHLASSAATTLLQFNDSGSGGTAAQVRIGSAGNDFVVLNNTGSNTATERLRITSGGSVGIGTTSPGRQLQINGDSDTQIRVVSSAGGTAGIQFGDTADTVRGGVNFDSSDNSLQFRGYNNNERVRIDNSGRLLVGTTDATNNIRLDQKLAIVSTGDNNYAGMNMASYRGAYSGAAPFIDFSTSRGTTDGSFTSVQSGDILGYLVFRGATGSQWDFFAQITGEVDGIPSTGNAPGRLVFSTTDAVSTNSTERMRIDSSGRLLVNRSASTSNGAIAQFASSAGPHISVNNTTGAGAYMLFQNSASGDGGADGLFVGTDGAAKAYLWNYESGLVFGNNNASVGQFIGSKFNVPGVYNGTTTGGGPVYVESDGDLLRYTSSLKYKTDVETLEDARADAILNCRPVWYRSKCENDIKTEGAEKSDWDGTALLQKKLQKLNHVLLTGQQKIQFSKKIKLPYQLSVTLLITKPKVSAMTTLFR